jgi:hypothetical protein
MSETLTVSELAERITRNRPAEWKTDVVRQIRYWTVEGVLRPDGPKHTGAGRHRRYAAEAVYLGAVVLELAEIRIPVGLLKEISGALQIIAQVRESRKGRLWHYAIAGTAEVYLRCEFKISPVKDEPLTLLVDLLTPADVVRQKGRIVTGTLSAIMMNLTTIFRWMRG